MSKRSPPWRKALPVPPPGKGCVRIYAKWSDGNSVAEAVFDVEGVSSKATVDLVKVVRDLAPKVHVLVAGSPFCDLGSPPSDWPDGHTWVRVDEVHLATCKTCVEGAEKWKKLQKPLTQERDIK